MKTSLAAFLTLVACAAMAQSNPAPLPEWKVLSDEAIALYQRGDIAGATAVGVKALAAAKADPKIEPQRIASMIWRSSAISSPKAWASSA